MGSSRSGEPASLRGVEDIKCSREFSHFFDEVGCVRTTTSGGKGSAVGVVCSVCTIETCITHYSSLSARRHRSRARSKKTGIIPYHKQDENTLLFHSPRGTPFLLSPYIMSSFMFIPFNLPSTGHRLIPTNTRFFLHEVPIHTRPGQTPNTSPTNV